MEQLDVLSSKKMGLNGKFRPCLKLSVGTTCRHQRLASLTAQVLPLLHPLKQRTSRCGEWCRRASEGCLREARTSRDLRRRGHGRMDRAVPYDYQHSAVIFRPFIVSERILCDYCVARGKVELKTYFLF